MVNVAQAETIQKKWAKRVQTLRAREPNYSDVELWDALTAALTEVRRLEQQANAVFVEAKKVKRRNDEKVQALEKQVKDLEKNNSDLQAMMLNQPSGYPPQEV